MVYTCFEYNRGQCQSYASYMKAATFESTSKERKRSCPRCLLFPSPLTLLARRLAPYFHLIDPLLAVALSLLFTCYPHNKTRHLSHRSVTPVTLVRCIFYLALFPLLHRRFAVTLLLPTSISPCDGVYTTPRRPQLHFVTFLYPHLRSLYFLIN